MKCLERETVGPSCHGEDLAFNVYRGSVWDAEDILDRDGGDS